MFGTLPGLPSQFAKHNRSASFLDDHNSFFQISNSDTQPERVLHLSEMPLNNFWLLPQVKSVLRENIICHFKNTQQNVRKSGNQFQKRKFKLFLSTRGIGMTMYLSKRPTLKKKTPIRASKSYTFK